MFYAFAILTVIAIAVLLFAAWLLWDQAYAIDAAKYSKPVNKAFAWFCVLIYIAAVAQVAYAF